MSTELWFTVALLLTVRGNPTQPPTVVDNLGSSVVGSLFPLTGEISATGLGVGDSFPSHSSILISSHDLVLIKRLKVNLLGKLLAC